MTSLWAESYLLLLRHAQTCHAKLLKLKSAGRTLPASFPLVGCLPAAAWPVKDFSKSQDAVRTGELRSVAHLPIDVGDIRQAIDRCSNIWASLQALDMVSSSIRLTAWLQNSKKRAERSEIDVWAESPRLSPLWLSCILVCLSWAVNHYRDNAITYKADATKMPENWSWRTRQCPTYRCVGMMLLRSMQNTRRSWRC